MEESSNFPPLQPLRIPSGWKVIWNALYQVQPQSDEETKWHHQEDLLMLKKDDWVVAVSWANEAGYRLTVINPNLYDSGIDPWQEPLYSFSTHSLGELIPEIERVLEGGWFSG